MIDGCISIERNVICHIFVASDVVCIVMCLFFAVVEVVRSVEATSHFFFVMCGSDSDGLICRFMLVSINQVLFFGVLFDKRFGRDGDGTLR